MTVADVAAAASVSEKTVFNYFATKEDLILDGRKEIEAELIQAVREREPGESIIAAVRRHTLSVAERMNALPAQRRAAFRKIIQNSPAVHARMRQMSLQHENELARFIAQETAASPADPTPYVVASILGVLSRLAYGVPGWPDGRRGSHAQMLAGIGAAFDLFEQEIADYGVKERR